MLYIALMSAHEDFVATLRSEMERRNTSIRAAALRSGVPVRSLHSILNDGRVPSINRAEELCEALGLEFYIGPPRDADPPGAGFEDSGSSPPYIPEPPPWAADLLERMESIEGRLPERPAVPGLEDAGALAVAAVPEGVIDVPGARPVQMVEMEAAAGDGALNLDEGIVIGPVWFRSEWIQRRGIDPAQAVVITVRSDSMEPTLPHGCKILVDRNRRRRRAGRIFVVHSDDGLVVKRMGRSDDGGWLLVSDSDSPDWPDRPWPAEGAEVVGEVRWMAREFP